ncbi:uncharacterized protein zmp:0000000881 [Entelurus aequoreus]|uniref:uncharacterized protein zmp:0000000881 n=1 Tax=Entelurus aequoreus TaxID=161455 RepID=UPI002B1E2C95|nr:uncharacterized protein zmp:0000000881 [Entelurus aequoreus]XP_061885857.1 uncharacterized protein zmp:0000000881 [Entelurus aequoreus]
MAFSTATLAEGCFGKVYKQKYNDTWAAVKKVPQHLIAQKDLEREYEVYKKANHPNIVKLLGKIHHQDKHWIIPLEFIFGENLETTIFNTAKSKIKLTPANKGKIIVGMCEGLLHLHALDIVHQDLKPDNIMVEHDTNRAIIIDLGLAKFFRCGLNSAIDMGNEAYSAPEVLQRRSQRDQRSDVWAMGKIIAELCARVRLHTLTFGPGKVREVMPEQPYCQAVCRMVEANPVRRASIVGVITDIRAAVATNRLRPPSTHGHPRNRSLSPSPLNRERGAFPFNEPKNKPPSPFNEPKNKPPSPFNEPKNRPPSPFQRDLSPVNTDLPRLGWERSSRTQLQVDRPRSGTPSPKRPEVRVNGRQDLVAAAVQDLTEGVLKIALYEEAARELCCKLPTTGRVTVQHYEENGGVGTWAQKEVVTRDGKIIKYNDITYNNQ